jgi:adenosine deaminase/adenosine deaminase CECR1
LRSLVGAIGVAILGAGVVLARPASPAASDPGEQRASRYFESIRHSPPEEWAFLREMPKGGDLHSHLSGAIYAESYVKWASEAGLCLQTQTLAVSPPPCDQKKSQAPLAAELADPSKNVYRDLIDAWSMRDWMLSRQSGHDHFFDTFARFGPAGVGHTGAMIAEVAARAARGHVSYLELMITPDGGRAAAAGLAAGWTGDADAAIAALARPAPGTSTLALDLAASASVELLRNAEAAERRLLECDTPRADPGCAVTVRWLYQVSRASALPAVFGQLALGFRLASDPDRTLVVGLNMVQPEDSAGSMNNFSVEMQMIKALRAHYPKAHLTLHAGELAPGLVPPEGLGFHIRDSVEIAGADRIGHGVDVMHETDADGLLDEMAAKHVMVEICLTSNDVILGIRGRDHPLAMYLRHGVPVALATDDEGVSRSEMSAEFVKAADEQGLGYQDLKAMARTSLEFAFISGASLWRDARRFSPVQECSNGTLGQATASATCQGFLDANPKAKLQWQLEGQFLVFEKKY